MKKIVSFLRSMKFGILLLGLIMVCLLIGSLIPQQSTQDSYVARYGQKLAQVFESLSLVDIFHSWYFYVLECLLMINLLLCSVVRIPSCHKNVKRFTELAVMNPQDTFSPKCEPAALEAFLKTHFFRCTEKDGKRLYVKNLSGFYGSALVHVSILFILVFGSIVLLFPTVKDYTLMPGESLSLDGGVTVRCDDFRISDETGRLDYASSLHVENESGFSKDQVVRVNEPLRFDNYKIYQQSYGTAGLVTVHNNENGAEGNAYLTESVRLFVDEKNGIQFNALYPGYIKNEDGNYTLITSSSNSYEDPVYDITVVKDGVYTPVLAFPGDEITIGSVNFRFEAPKEYPGLRVKTLSPVLYAGLYFGFGLMVVGLYLCFFAIPECVVCGEEGCAVFSPKDASHLLNELKLQFSRDSKDEGSET